MKFRIEFWRIAKFLLITAAVNVPMTLLNNTIVNMLVAASANAYVGTQLNVLSYAHIILRCIVTTLLHRYFTFRATEKWYIALPIMLVFALAWQHLSFLAMTFAARSSMQALITWHRLMVPLDMILTYLLQRYVIYCHTTDTNGWYRRLHPTNDEEGVTPHE